MDRRPLKVRSASWAKNFAAFLAEAGVTPNFISVLSMVFAAAALATGYLSRDTKIFLIVSALLVQLRLICNLLDGMVAVEHDKSLPNGELFNDVPDRFADAFIIIGSSFAITRADFFISPLNLAWMGATLAITTAYVRVLGKSLGTDSYFIGPMAKQHRMALVTVALVTEFFISGTEYAGLVLYSTLVLVALGSLATVIRRLSIISSDLMEEGQK